MSLKTFHLVFIVASILLGLGVGVWGIREYQAKGEIGALILGIIFLVMGGVLFVYGRRMLKKTKHIGYLCLSGFIFMEQNASACASCFGESDSTMAEGMNAGVLTLLIIVGGTLAAIAGFFIYLIRRGTRYAAKEALLLDPELLGLKTIDLSKPANKTTRLF